MTVSEHAYTSARKHHSYEEFAMQRRTREQVSRHAEWQEQKLDERKRSSDLLLK
jgi:hypothetical protein